MSKVIDLSAHRKVVTQNDDKLKKMKNKFEPVPNAHEVYSFDEKKKNIVVAERRSARRTMLNEMMSSMVVIPERGLLKVYLHDISGDGLSFETAKEEGSFSIGEQLFLRIYINHKTYFPVKVTIKHISEEPESGTIRHGATLAKDAGNDVVLQHFVKFVETAAMLLKKDNGDIMINKTS